MHYLLKHHTHPTVDEIYLSLNRSMPTLSKTTVYSTLKLFAEKEAVCIISIDEKNARFDANTEAHAHFQCTKCGAIYDIPLPAQSDSNEGQLPCNPNLKDFTVNETHIYLKGICPKCKTSEK